MEYFDIYTADGCRTGKTAAKGTPCGDGEYYLGVHIYLYDSQGRFLLQRRSLSKKFLPGAWETHLGHAEAGESSTDTAIREISEELSVRLHPEDLTHILRLVWNEEHHIIDVFFCRTENIEISRLHWQKEEVMDVKWVSKEEILDFIHDMDYRPIEYREAVLQYIKCAVFPSTSLPVK